MKKKSRVYYFGGKRKVRQDAGFKSIKDIQLEPGAIQKVNYKTGIFKDGIPEDFKERKKLYEAKRRFLINVARAIKIAKLERQAGEESLNDPEKLQLIKLYKEFDYYNTVVTLERLEKESRERSGVYETQAGFKKHEVVSDPFAVAENKPSPSQGRTFLGGKSEGKEAQLKMILIKHEKAIGWSEGEYKQALAKQRGKKTAAILEARKKRTGKEVRGRKKGTVFDAALGRYVRAGEQGK